MKTKTVGIIAVALFVVVALALGYWWVRNNGAGSAEDPETSAQLWTCPMHPDILLHEPGNCPICNMKLVPVETSAPMDMEMESNEPMDIESGEPMGDTGEHAVPQAAGPTVHVSPAFLQNFAVRTTVADRGPIPLDLNTIGVLQYDQKKIVSISTKFEGWIESATVNYIGEEVQKGDLLFEIYSPQLVTTQKEYLAALDYLDRLSDGGRSDAIDRARNLLDATRERLRWWDITDEQIAALDNARQVTRTLKIYSPVSGVLVEKMGDSLEGMKLTPGMTVFKLADLSTIWADVEVYEHQIQHLSIGQTVRIAVDAFPGRQWTGRITYFDPTIDPKTRTLRARVEIQNPDRALRPEMYANVNLQPPAANNVVRVPREVVLHTGERSVVIVQRRSGVFEPREVELGASGGNWQEVRSGIDAGETLVASSQFLIDSESNLREAINQMLAGSESESAATPIHQH